MARDASSLERGTPFGHTLPAMMDSGHMTPMGNTLGSTPDSELTGLGQGQGKANPATPTFPDRSCSPKRKAAEKMFKVILTEALSVGVPFADLLTEVLLVSGHQDKVLSDSVISAAMLSQMYDHPPERSDTPASEDEGGGCSQMCNWSQNVISGVSSTQEKEQSQTLWRLFPDIQSIREVMAQNPKVFLTNHLFTQSWTVVFFVCAIWYFVNIIFFAVLLYLGGDDAVIGLPDDVDATRFVDAFHLSVHTFSTIGYGSLQPNTLWAHIVVSFVGFWSVVYASILGGAIFMKLIRPDPRVKFSRNICIKQKEEGCPWELHFRSVQPSGQWHSLPRAKAWVCSTLTVCY